METPTNEEPKAKKTKAKGSGSGQLFTLKKWNAVAMWSWDVECDTCAICRVQVMGELECSDTDMYVHLVATDACLRCQTDGKQEECIGEGVYHIHTIS